MTPHDPSQHVQILTRASTQTDRLRQAIADAVGLQTESAEGWCGDCEVGETGRCLDHQAILQQRVGYDLR